MQTRVALRPVLTGSRLLSLSLTVALAACTPPAPTAGNGTGGGAPSTQTGGTSGTAGTGGGAAPVGSGGAPAGSGGAVATTGGAPGGATGGTAGTAAGGSGSGSASGGRGGSAGSIAGTGGRQGGSGVTGGTTGSGGAMGGPGGQGTGTGTFQKASGTIPNSPQPASTINLPKADWKKGLISPSLQVGRQLAQPTVIDGHLVMAGNEEFWIYDVANPVSPKQLSTFTTPNRTGGEAESHTVSYARYGNSFYMVTIGGRGIDTWDVTNVAAPKHLAQLKIPGTNYGDYTEAVWGVTWQGQYIYVGATNNGIKVVDAANPAAPTIAAEVPTSQYGGVSAGPLDAIGNVLVVMTPKESGGIATLDISDPLRPVRLASVTTDKAYIGMFYRRWVFFIGVTAWDVLTNPKNLGSSPLGRLGTEGSEYMSFADDYMFLGHVRADIGGNPGASKITVADPRSMKVASRIWGRMDRNNLNDDQFTLPLGNLLVLADDQSPYAGWVIAVHAAEPDTKAPVVDTVIPANNATAVSTKSRIGLSFSDNIELATVNAASLIVRPMGGQPLAGKFGVRMSVVNFDPDQDLQPGTIYEVILPKGGVADLVGNTMAAEWKSTFTTN
jgi:hypothetical protein